MRSVLILWQPEAPGHDTAPLGRALAAAGGPDPGSGWSARCACMDSRSTEALCGLLTGVGPLGRPTCSRRTGRILRRTLLGAAKAGGWKTTVIGEGTPPLDFAAAGQDYRDLSQVEDRLLATGMPWLALVCLAPASVAETTTRLRRLLGALPGLDDTLLVVTGAPDPALPSNETQLALHAPTISARRARLIVSQTCVAPTIAELAGIRWQGGDGWSLAGEIVGDRGPGQAGRAFVSQIYGSGDDGARDATLLYDEDYRLIRRAAGTTSRSVLERLDGEGRWQPCAEPGKADDLAARLADLEARARPARSGAAMRRSLLDLRYAL